MLKSWNSSYGQLHTKLSHTLGNARSLSLSLSDADNRVELNK